MRYNSTKEKEGYAELRDYRMSKIFGLNWQEYPTQRMQMLMEIDSLINELESEQYKNNQK